MKTLLLTLVILLAGAGIVSAQTKSAPLDLQYQERPPAVMTVPPGQIESDTTQAMSEIDRQRTEEIPQARSPKPGVDDQGRDDEVRAWVVEVVGEHA